MEASEEHFAHRAYSNKIPGYPPVFMELRIPVPGILLWVGGVGGVSESYWNKDILEELLLD